MPKKTGETAPPREYASAMDKVRDEMARAKDEKIRLLGEGLTAMLQLHPEWEPNVLADGKTIAGALGEVKKKAVGGCSDPIRTTRSLCEYYSITCGDVHRLALEVTRAMIGEGDGETMGEAQTYAETAAEPDPFDLAALMGGDS